MVTFSINATEKQAAFLPAGFSELKKIYEQKMERKGGDIILSYGTIKKELFTQFNFTDGKIAGTVRRASQKGLLIPLDNGAYKFNEKFPEIISNNTSNMIATLKSTNEADILDQIKKIFNCAVNDLASGLDISSIDEKNLLLIRRICMKMLEAVNNDTTDKKAICDIINTIDDFNILSSISATILDTIAELNGTINILAVSESVLIEIHSLLEAFNEWAQCAKARATIIKES